MFALAAAMILALAGCISSTSRDSAADYDLQRPGDMDRLATAIADRRLVFVGETHTRMDHHRLQLAVIESLQRAGRDLAIGVEWFQQPAQPVVDDFLAGRIDEASLLHRSNWFDHWRFDYRLYRDIIRFARAEGIPLLALNAPQKLTAAVSRHGVADVPAGLKPELPSSYDRSNKEYETTLRRIFDYHAPRGEAGGDPDGETAVEERFARFVDVQLTWDETMAEKSADYLAAHPEKTLVVLAGSGHIAFGAGIPDRVQRRHPVPATIILTADVAAEMPGSAEFFVATRSEELPPAGMLGIFLREDGPGLVVSAFSEPSGAQAAGLILGDRILGIGDSPVPNLAALKLVLADRTPGEVVRLDYERPMAGGTPQRMSASVTLN